MNLVNSSASLKTHSTVTSPGKASLMFLLHTSTQHQAGISQSTTFLEHTIGRRDSQLLSVPSRQEGEHP